VTIHYADNKLLRRACRDERGITGLETAIILIAFVVVAAVFAYTVLSAGMFATQQSQASIYSGLEEAQSSITTKGSVIAKAENTGANGYISQISFTVANVLGDGAMLLTSPDADGANTGLAASGSSNVVTISYTDAYQNVNDLYYTVTKLGSADADDLLEEGEKFQITIGNATSGASGGNLVDALNPDLTAGKEFTITVTTPMGAVLILTRTTPDVIDGATNLR
jgi:archaeal flagellin FlaB